MLQKPIAVLVWQPWHAQGHAYIHAREQYTTKIAYSHIINSYFLVLMRLVWRICVYWHQDIINAEAINITNIIRETNIFQNKY